MSPTALLGNRVLNLQNATTTYEQVKNAGKHGSVSSATIELVLFQGFLERKYRSKFQIKIGSATPHHISTRVG